MVFQGFGGWFLARFWGVIWDPKAPQKSMQIRSDFWVEFGSILKIASEFDSDLFMKLHLCLIFTFIAQPKGKGHCVKSQDFERDIYCTFEIVTLVPDDNEILTF